MRENQLIDVYRQVDSWREDNEAGRERMGLRTHVRRELVSVKDTCRGYLNCLWDKNQRKPLQWGLDSYGADADTSVP